MRGISGRDGRHLVAALTGLGLGLLALGPGLAPGFILSYDMVFVPEPAFTRLTFGLTGTVPRHVPSDVFVTALGSVIPADIVQKLVLLAIFVMACVSAASLVPSERMLPRLAAGVCYAWNPFVAERLLIGQWALLLGYAALPWVVGAAARVGERGGGRRLLLCLLPAAIGGFAALAVSGMTALVVALFAGRVRAGVRVVGVLAVLSLPWLVPGLLRPGGVPEDGTAVEAFAARADTPFGTLGSLLMLGGVWNGETVPRGYGTPLLAVLWLAVVVIALVAYWLWAREPGVVAAACVGFVVAALGAVAAPVLAGLIDLWAGFAVFRDGQQFVAPLAVVVAVGLGAAADRAMDARLPVVAAGAVLVPLLLLPTLAWGAAGDLRAVRYPDAWTRARQIVAADETPGDVLVLPWAAYRSHPWNHGRRVLEPLPRFLHRRVIMNDAVRVDGTTVAPEDPRAVRIEKAAPLTAVTLREEGVRFVVVDATADVPGARVPGTVPDGLVQVLQSRDLALYRVDGPVTAYGDGVPVVPVVVAWVLVAVGILWSIVAPRTTL